MGPFRVHGLRFFGAPKIIVRYSKPTAYIILTICCTLLVMKYSSRRKVYVERAQRQMMLFATESPDVDVEKLFFSNHTTFRHMFLDSAEEHSWEMGDKKFEIDLAYKCRRRDYDIKSLGKASIIISFHEVELLENVIHTLHSIVQNTPHVLLQEVILIADNTDNVDHGNRLEDYMNTNFPALVKLHRSKTQLGLIKARQMGAMLATADVIVSMDSHVEVQRGWLQSMLLEIKKDNKTMCSSTLDWLKPKDDGTWLYHHGPSRYVTVWYWFRMAFTFMEIGHHLKGVIDPTEPILSPCSVGTIWAMNRKFFFEIGGLDEGMEFWGGENIDLSLRVFMAGGKHVNVPCSHAAHMEVKGQRNYRKGHEKSVAQNHVRYVEALFDPAYKQTFYHYNPQWKGIANLTKRQRFPKSFKYNFTYVMENLYPQLKAPNVHTLAWGWVVNVGIENSFKFSSLCFCAFPNHQSISMDYCDLKEPHNKAAKSTHITNPETREKATDVLCMKVSFQTYDLSLIHCAEGEPISGGIFVTNEGELRLAAHIINPPIYNMIYNAGHNIPQLYIRNYFDVSGTSNIPRWFHVKDGPIKLHDPQQKLNHCIGIVYRETTPMITLVQCDYTSPHQAWRFKFYTDEYTRLVDDHVIPYRGRNEDIALYYKHYLKFIREYKTAKQKHH